MTKDENVARLVGWIEGAFSIGFDEWEIGILRRHIDYINKEDDK